MESKRSAVQPVDDVVLVKSVELALTPTAVFALFNSNSGLESWLCERASVEPRFGGRYELFWEPTDPENDSTIGCRTTAYEPDRLIAFQWRSPRQFKSFANGADPLTHVVVTLHAVERGCRVTLVHSGWRSTPEWVQAAEWQSRAWDYAFQALNARAGAHQSGTA